MSLSNDDAWREHCACERYQRKAGDGWGCNPSRFSRLKGKLCRKLAEIYKTRSAQKNPKRSFWESCTSNPLQDCTRVSSQGRIKMEDFRSEEGSGGSITLPDSCCCNAGETNNNWHQCPPTRPGIFSAVPRLRPAIIGLTTHQNFELRINSSGSVNSPQLLHLNFISHRIAYEDLIDWF